MTKISSWGRLNAHAHTVIDLTNRHQLPISSQTQGIAFGMGRSYGDICLNPGGILWRTTRLDRFIHFNEQTGVLKCEAGVLLKDIQRLMVPRGWILPVTPGTQLISVGGAIANDVHGKNHHILGSFGDHLRHIRLLRTSGEIIECSPEEKPDWFAASVGGLGLTGMIIEADIQLRKVTNPWLDTETLPYKNLDSFFDLADTSESAWEHTVSWIDCVSNKGRGIFMRGNPNTRDKLGQAPPQNRTVTMPVTPPFSLVNKFTLRPFNMSYFYLNAWQAGLNVTHYEKFLYPLDNLLEWNRMYGPKGFYQYQSVIPRITGKQAVLDMLKEITRSNDGSFLAVLKTFGNRQPVGMMSFPQPGVTLALDFPNKGKRTIKLFERLDRIVREADGRLYLAKDARMPRDLLESGYPRLNEFLAYRDPGISSALSRRLMGF